MSLFVFFFIFQRSLIHQIDQMVLFDLTTTFVNDTANHKVAQDTAPDRALLFRKWSPQDKLLSGQWK